MLIRHATPRKNLSSIRKGGLLTSKSKGKLPAVWLHAMGKTPWAILHVAKRHKARAESVIVLEISVPRRWLRRARRGLWYCLRDVPPSRIRQVIGFAEVAGTSLEPIAG
jgi:hypothetical protein